MNAGLPHDQLQYMRQMINGIVKLQAPTELYDEFHVWLTDLPITTLRAYIQDVGGFANHATIQSTETEGTVNDPDIRMKAEQSVAFYALAIWRKYELRPLTKM